MPNSSLMSLLLKVLFGFRANLLKIFWACKCYSDRTFAVRWKVTDSTVGAWPLLCLPRSVTHWRRSWASSILLPDSHWVRWTAWSPESKIQSGIVYGSIRRCLWPACQYRWRNRFYLLLIPDNEPRPWCCVSLPLNRSWLSRPFLLQCRELHNAGCRVCQNQSFDLWWAVVPACLCGHRHVNTTRRHHHAGGWWHGIPTGRLHWRTLPLRTKHLQRHDVLCRAACPCICGVRQDTSP